MSFSDIPPWVYVFLIWYASGVYTIGSLFAAMVWGRESVPVTGWYWVWVLALLGSLLLLHVLIWRREDLGKGFVITKRGMRRLKEKVDWRYKMTGWNR